MSRRQQIVFVPTSDDDGYAGSATLAVGASSIPVEVFLAGHLEPLDGRYHWYGRIQDRSDALGAHVQGVRSATLRIGDGPVVDARLGECDPWGNLRVTGVGVPPFRLAPVSVELRP